MNPVIKLLAMIQTVGSVFGKTGADGRKEVAVGPIAIVYITGMSVACYTQSAEPFSQCVRTIFSVLGG